MTPYTGTESFVKIVFGPWQKDKLNNYGRGVIVMAQTTESSPWIKIGTAEGRCNWKDLTLVKPPEPYTTNVPGDFPKKEEV